MKIGIITLPLHNNYGGILQAYALQRVLQKLGHDAMVIDRERYIRLPLYRKGLSYCKRLIKKDRRWAVFFYWRTGKGFKIVVHLILFCFYQLPLQVLAPKQFAQQCRG